MNSKQKIALVTGASGFIGKHLSHRLLQEGWTVHAIVRPTTDTDALIDFAGKNIICHSYDGNSDRLVAIVRNVQPSVVFHLASLFLSSHQFENIHPLITSNVIFSTQLVEAMVQNEVYHLVNTGTSWEHYQNAQYNPVNLYAATKQAFLDILKYYQATSPIRVITLKLFDTYGPCDNRAKLFHLLERVVQTNEPLKMSPGEQLIDLVYIDDVVDAFYLAAKLLSDSSDYTGEYAVSSTKPIKLRELIAIYENIRDKKLPIEWGKRPYRQREVMEPWNTGDLLPGWSPETSLEKGIKKLLNN